MNNQYPNNWFSFDWFKYSTLSSYSWENQFFLYLLILIPILFLVKIFLSNKNKLEVSIPKYELKSNHISLLRFLPKVLIAICFILLIISISRPQKSNEKVERWTDGIDIMLVIDISESMQIEDFKPNRLESAKEVAKKFVNGRFQDRIGLVVFSGESYSRCPLTTDYDLLNSFIDDIDFSLIESRGTAIGSSIAVATNRMKESNSKSKVLILLSDGDNTAGNIDPITAAKIANAYNIKIYTIAVGKEGRVPFGKDFFGNTRFVENTLDESNLKKIAEIGKGMFFRASNNESLKEIFEIIDTYEKVEIKESRYKETVDYYQYYLLWSIIFFITWMMVKNTFINNSIVD